MRDIGEIEGTMAQSLPIKESKHLDALLSSVAVPTNRFDVLGSTDSGSVTPIIRLSKFDVLAAAAGPTPPGPAPSSTPNGGASGNDESWGLERVPPSRKNLTYFKFLGAWGHQTFTLTAGVKARDNTLTSFVADPRFNGQDVFVQALRTNLNDPATLDLNRVPGLARSLNIQLGANGNDKSKVKVTLQRGDVFAIAPDGDKHFRIYTAYTGLFFYFKMEDKGTFRYRISKRGVSGAGDGFSALVAPEVSKQYSFLTPMKYLRPLWGQFDRTVAKINKLVNVERRKILVKRNRFTYRLGDIVTGFNGTTQNWLVVRQIYNKNIDKNFYILVRDNGTSFAQRTWTELEPLTAIQEAPGGINGLQQLPNIQYVRTLLYANPSTGDEVRNTQAFNDIFTALQPKVNEVIRTMALDPLEADVRPQARDMNRELPTNPQRDPNNAQLKPGNIIFLTSLPNQTTNVMAPADNAEYTRRFDDERQQIINSTPNPTQQAALIAALRARYDNMQKSGLLSQPREITFHDSQGWYLIVRSKPLDNESKIEWTLVPYPQKRKIRATVPVTVKLEDRRANAQRGPFAPKPPERTTTSTKDVYLDYVVLRLDMQGGNELGSLIQHQAVLDAQVNSVQWPKDGNKAFKAAEQFVTERDMSGNLRKVKVGDIVNYEDQYFYVANVKRVNKGQQYTIAPLRAFVDLKTSTLEPPFQFQPGGLPAIGYRVITTPAEGADSFDQKARKVATAYQLQDSSIKELFIRYYSEYKEDGTPRPEPLSAHRNTMIDEGTGIKPAGSDTSVDPEFFSTNKGGKPKFDGAKSAPVQNQEQRIERDRNVVNRVQRAVESGQLRPGMLITYDWGNNHMTTEIFYEIVDKDRIRLVPHESGDLHSKPDGIVPAKGFFEVYRGPNVPKPGFWDNLNSGFYQSASSPHRFRFAPNFRENFSKIIQAAGGVVPQGAQEAPADYIGADDPKEVMSRKRYRDGLFESAADKAINAMIDEYGLDRDIQTASINTGAAPPNPPAPGTAPTPSTGKDTYLGLVIQYVRNGQILRSVIQSGVISNWVPAQLKELKIYPDAKSGMNTRVLLKDIDKFVTPQDVDPSYSKNEQLHKQMQSKFAQFIVSNPDPDVDFLDPEVRDYYWTYFGIDLD